MSSAWRGASASMRRALSSSTSSTSRVMTRRVSSCARRDASRPGCAASISRSSSSRNGTERRSSATQNTGAQPVVEVVRVVRDVVRDPPAAWRLRGRVAVEAERLAGRRSRGTDAGCRSPGSARPAPRRDRAAGRCASPAPSRVSKVRFSPSWLGVAALQPGHDAQRLGVVVEPAEPRHAIRQRVLAGMAERRVAEVVPRAPTASARSSSSPSERPSAARDLAHLQSGASAGCGNGRPRGNTKTCVLCVRRRNAPE